MFAFNATANAFASAFFALASPEMSPSDVLDRRFNSMDVAGCVQLFHLQPSELFLNHVSVAMVYLLLSVLPTLYVLYALLQHRSMHHSDKFICTWSWIVVLIVLGHHSAMEFLHPQLFAVVKWLSILYLFVFYVTMPVYWCAEKLIEKLLERPDTAGTGGGVNATVVAVVPRGERGRNALPWRYRRKREHLNRRKYRRARKAFAKLIPVYANSKRNNPHRFRSGSGYRRQLLECKLFKQGIDTMFLEMRLRMEFHPTLLTTLVQQSWEEAAFDEVYNGWMEELDEPHEEVLVPRGVAPTGANGGGEEDDMPDEEAVVPGEIAPTGANGGGEEDGVPDEDAVVPGEVAPTGANEGGEGDGVPDEEVVFPVPGGEEEESEVPGEGFVVPGEEVDLVHEVQVLPRKRRRGRSEAEALRSDLGRYWEPSSNRGMVLRRSCRTRRPPVRYTP